MSDLVYPQGTRLYAGVVMTEGGLTIRQHFAAMALQGILANPERKMEMADSSSEVDHAIWQADELIRKLGVNP